MQRLGATLLSLSLWTAPLLAQEAPEVAPGDDGTLFVVDPLPGDEVDLAAQSGILEMTTLEVQACPLEHEHHPGELGADGLCHEAACECLHHLPLADGSAVPGEELMFYSLASASGVANENVMDRNAPLPNARGLETAALNSVALNMSATANTPAALQPRHFDASQSLLREQLLRSSVPGIDSRSQLDPGRAAREPGLFNRLLVRNTAPAAVTAADQDYARRLAAIDTLRDQALASGDETRLQQADRLEQELKGGSTRGLRWFRR